MTVYTQRPAPLLVLGPAHSGKSEFALQLLAPDLPAVVIGTATMKDRQFAARLKALSQLRPPAWETVETATDVAAAATQALARSPQVLIDSVNLWLAALVVEGGERAAEESGQDDPADPNDPASSPVAEPGSFAAGVEARALAQVDELCRLATSQKGKRLVFVSAELGASAAPARPAERLLRRLVGLANQRLARVSKTVYSMTAGIPFALKE